MADTNERAGAWEALLGRGPGAPPLPADVDLWDVVVERLNPARARPRLRDGVERVHLTAMRQGDYVMLRSPDDGESVYVRLHPDEWALAQRMDGTRTVAQLVGVFAEITGRLAPDQVRRVVADLAGGRMLDELPLDAFASLRRIRPAPWPVRLGRSILSGLAGRRIVLANPDRVAAAAYRFGGRALFTRAGAATMVVVALAGFVVFIRSFVGGGLPAFRVGDSHLLGGLVLLALNVVGLACHEAGHALATKHAGRHVPALGVMAYFGIPSAFVDTTDMWMADRKHRLITSAAGPGFALTFAGAAQLVGLVQPQLAPLAFQLGFVWYLNSLFNLNPFMALDGYYLCMDWLEVPNLRARGISFLARVVRRPSTLRANREGEDRLVAYYAVGSLLWLVVMLSMFSRVYVDRFASLGLTLWGSGWTARLLMVSLAALLAAPALHAIAARAAVVPGRIVERLRGRNREAGMPARLDGLRRSRLGSLQPAALEALARDAVWVRPRRGSEVAAAGAAATGVLAVATGALEGRAPGDPHGHLRARAEPGDLVGMAEVLGGRPMALSWSAAGTRLLHVPGTTFQEVVGPLVPGRPAVERAEAETLLDRAPAFDGLSPDARLALAATMTPVDIPPGTGFGLADGYAAVVGAGVVDLGGGGRARHGDLIGPSGGDPIRGRAMTSVRLWQLPATGGLAALLGELADRPARAAAHRSPQHGMHGDVYAPLHLPWGAPPPAPGDDDVDDRLARQARWWVLLLLLLALLALWFATGAGPAWAELPEDTALLEVDRGTVEVLLDGEHRLLEEGDRVVVDRSDEVVVHRRSLARLEFRGGAESLLCPHADVVLGGLRTVDVSPARPVGAFEQRAGRVITDTRSDAADFDPLSLTISLRRAIVATDGHARMATTPWSVVVTAGAVTLDGSLVAITEGPLGCGTSGRGGDGDPLGPATSTSHDASTTTAGPIPRQPTTTPETTSSRGGRRPRATTTTTKGEPGGTTTTTTAGSSTTSTSTTSSSSTTSTSTTTTSTTLRPTTTTTTASTTTTTPPRRTTTTTTTTPRRTTTTTAPSRSTTTTAPPPPR